MSWTKGFQEVSRGAAVLARIGARIALPVFFVGGLLGTGVVAHAGLVINPTFDSSITNDGNAAGIEGAINAAISAIEGDITSPHDIAVSIYFAEGGGLGESNTTLYGLSYQAYYNAFAAIATQPSQITALASLGTPPTGPGSGNPVNGTPQVDVTSAEARNLGFGTAVGAINGTYDSEIMLNTSITYPPGANNGSNYGLQAVANHEIDEVLGIGGTGSTIGSPLPDPGDLDLYRYTCSDPNVATTLTCPAGDVIRSYSTTQTTTPYSYFSIDGGHTVLSFFNQTDGADYADWLSNPIPAGFQPQVQDAFGGPGTDPVLGANELTAFNAIGYDLVAPEPSTLLLFGSALAIIAGLGLRKTRQS